MSASSDLPQRLLVLLTIHDIADLLRVGATIAASTMFGAVISPRAYSTHGS